jgi:phage N-6-adenine-methyltransferase
MSETDHYNTPLVVLEPIYHFIGGSFDLDPCSNPTSIVRAKQTYDETSNGLVQNWVDADTVFVNPPYSKPNLALWSRKCAEESRMDRTGLFLLIPVSTATNWWHEYIVPVADAVLFYKGRISFTFNGKPGPGNRHDSCLVYFGSMAVEFQKHFSSQGWVYVKQSNPNDR